MSRMLIVAGMILVFGASADAQPRELKGSQGRAVFVIDANRQEWQGRLLHVSAEALEVESDAGIRTFNLAEIRRVDADGDGVWDGAWKGAAIGAALGLIPVAYGATGWAVASNAFWTGLLGLAIDGGCSSRHPVYHGPAMPATDKPVAPSSPALHVSMRVGW